MAEKRHGRVSFMELVDRQLEEYEREKLQRASRKRVDGECAKKEQIARAALMELGEEHWVEGEIEEDVQIGRWSNYRVQDKAEERVSLTRKTKQNEYKAPHEYRYLAERERPGLQFRSQSQKTIPKLKCILHQLEASLHLPDNRLSHRPSESAKNLRPKKTEVLMASNKQETTKSSATTERKMAKGTETAQNRENSRPTTHTVAAQPQQSQKSQLMRRPFGFANQDNEPVYEKQVLSQLIKGSLAKPTPSTSPLRNMLNYFTASGSNKVSRGSSRNGLDKILC